MSALLVVVGGLGVVWASKQPSTVKACQLAGAIDEKGSTTAENARVRFASEVDLGIDVDRPDDVSGSNDRAVAIYLLDGPERGPVDRSRTYYRQLVTERDEDGLWRIVDANRCARWTE